MNYWYGYNPNCGRCGHLNGHGYCSMTACIYYTARDERQRLFVGVPKMRPSSDSLQRAVDFMPELRKEKA